MEIFIAIKALKEKNTPIDAMEKNIFWYFCHDFC
jgi:hypothetical protein